MAAAHLDAELIEAKKFHGHLGPYLVLGMRMGHFIASVFGEKPFSYRIDVSVGWKPPPSCVIDGIQITTPCTVGNSMIRVEEPGDIKAWAEKDGERLELKLRPAIRERIDSETTRENEEAIAQQIWEESAEGLFIIRQYSIA
jgi:formylmethanofuran dehydrogenase subunit E